MTQFIFLLKNIFLAFCIIGICQNTHCQDLKSLEQLRLDLVHHEVYSPGSTYKYQAIKLNAQGDTLSTEIVRMNIDSTINQDNDDPNKIYFIWEYTSRASYETALRPSSHSTTGKDWMDSDTTTLSFDENDLYIHPIRENQYYQAEVAPHPTIKFNSKQEDESYQSKIVILKGFGKYNMKEYLSKYVIQPAELIPYNGAQIKGLRLIAETEIKAFTFGSAGAKPQEGTDIFKDAKLSKASFLLSGQYGFMTMNFDFYDGEKLSLSLIP